MDLKHQYSNTVNHSFKNILNLMSSDKLDRDFLIWKAQMEKNYVKITL